MLGGIAIVISNTLFVLIEFIWKQQRQAGVSSVGNLAMLGFAVPIFLFSIFVLFPVYLPTASFNFSLEYWIYLAAWLLPVFISNFGYVFLFKFQSLIEQNAYKIGFSTLIALLLDIFFLKIEYGYILYGAVACFLFSGFLLSKNRTIKTKDTSLAAILGVLFIVSALGALEWSIYKKAFDFQPHILLHIFIAQSVLFSLFFIVGIRDLITGVKTGAVTPKNIAITTALIVPFVFLEGFALSQLPVAIVVLANVWPLALYAVFDVKTEQLKLSKTSGLAFLGVVTGIILLALSDL